MMSLSKPFQWMARASLRCRMNLNQIRNQTTVPVWSSVDPSSMSSETPAQAYNLVGGVWSGSKHEKIIPDPLTGEGFMRVPDTKADELYPFVESARTCPKAGLHNPLLNPDRYKLYGEICAKMATELAKPEVETFFTKLIQRVAPKHRVQAQGEVKVLLQWLRSFSGDSIRQLARSFAVPGDSYLQESRGYRWPYGHVAVITPFNFSLEIPSIQAMSALFMGNRPLVKVDEKVSIVMEQFVRLAIHCGMPATDIDLLYSDGLVANQLLLDTKPRMTLFTGSQHVADKLCADLNGRIKLEDAGFNWKIMGHDVNKDIFEYTAWRSDQDAYAFSGQKCSAQSLLFLHENWKKAGFIEAIKKIAESRTFDDLSICPLLSVTNERITTHIESLLKLPGSSLLFGGPVTEDHAVPEKYGLYKPTAVYIPIEEIANEKNFDLVTTEIFGPLQVITEYDSSNTEVMYDILERLSHNLTAGVVSQDHVFVQEVLSRTINGTTYAGSRARTTGAPAQHWFGPAGDPRAGGIHTIEAVQMMWSSHREIVMDQYDPRHSAEWQLTPPT